MQKLYISWHALVKNMAGADPGGVDWVASHPPLLRSFKLEIKKMNKTITEATLSPIVLILV